MRSIYIYIREILPFPSIAPQATETHSLFSDTYTMAYIDPTGGNRQISQINTRPASVFAEELNDPDMVQEDWTPLVQEKPQVVPGLSQGSGGTSRKAWLDKQKLNYRTRLFFRITSLIASGTALGSLGSVLFTYTKTRHMLSHHGGQPVWPQRIRFQSTFLMLAAAVVTFVADITFFAASIKVQVRKLENWLLKLLALGVTCVCLTLVSAAVAVSEIAQKDPNKSTLMWVCDAKELDWDEAVTVDFPFLCGEMVGCTLLVLFVYRRIDRFGY